MTIQGHALLERLKTDTRALHTQAERHTFQGALMSGRADRTEYASYLEQLLLMHLALEDRLRALAGEEPFASILTDEQYQEPYLREDLEALRPGREDAAPVPSIREASDTIAAADPMTLLGMHYVLEGSNNGGRYIARALAKAYELRPGGPGLRYFDPYGERQPEVWASFKDSFGGAAFTEAQADAVFQGAKYMFGRMIALFDDLSAQPARS